jgi:hypothetical protein
LVTLRLRYSLDVDPGGSNSRLESTMMGRAQQGDDDDED